MLISLQPLNQFACGLFYKVASSLLPSIGLLSSVDVYGWRLTHMPCAKMKGCQFDNNYDNSVITGPIALKPCMHVGTYLAMYIHVSQLGCYCTCAVARQQLFYDLENGWTDHAQTWCIDGDRLVGWRAKVNWDRLISNMVRPQSESRSCATVWVSFPSTSYGQWQSFSALQLTLWITTPDCWPWPILLSFSATSMVQLPPSVQRLLKNRMLRVGGPFVAILLAGSFALKEFASIRWG